MRSLLACLLSWSLCLSLTTADTTVSVTRNVRPNIVFILVDDQDFLLDSYKHMTTLQTELIEKGILFTKHYGHV